MGTNWTIEIIGSNLLKGVDDLYLWLRFDGFPKFALKFLRDAYKKQLEMEKSMIANPREDLYALLLIRADSHVEGWTLERENRHVIVRLHEKTVELRGDWYPAFGKQKNQKGTYPLEVSEDK
jgi:hypothetical protein